MLSQWDARDVVSHLDTKRNLSKRNVQMNLQKLMDTSYRKTLILKTLASSDDDIVYIRKSDFI